jgi:hypothetical protein
MFKFLLIFNDVLIVILAQVPPPTPAPLGHCLNPGDAVYGDYCYNFNPFKYIDWPSARYACRKLKMELVSISNTAELNFVSTVMLNARQGGKHLSQNIWIGLNRGFSSEYVCGRSIYNTQLRADVAVIVW